MGRCKSVCRELPVRCVRRAAARPEAAAGSRTRDRGLPDAAASVFWNAELPIGIGFRCPIPAWTARETHVVIRSGSQDCGEWLDEARDVHGDDRKYIGGTPPANIVRVWLIAVSLFRGQEGRCRYADIVFVTEQGVAAVS